MPVRKTLLILLACALPCLALDQNGNGQSDVWESIFNATGLAPGADADHDGWTNAQEAAAGTDPHDPLSFPLLRLEAGAAGHMMARWPGLAGKKYTLEMSSTLGSGTWAPLGSSVTGAGAESVLELDPAGTPSAFFRLRAEDQDSDGDGISDWEEMAVGYDPHNSRTGRQPQLDAQSLPAALAASSVITVSVYDDTCSERWPAPGVIAVRRTGGLKPLTVNVAFSGTALRGPDYTASVPGNTVSFGPGVREVFVELNPIADNLDGESTETIVLTALSGTGYTVGTQNTGTVSLLNETATSGPSPKAAARFLIQAAFGPDQDAANDTDQIPENVEDVMALGFSAWIDQQLARPVGRLTPFVNWAQAQPSSAEIYNDIKEDAWWGRVMGLPKLRPDASTTQLPDPLRQRMAYALSEIYIISDRMEELGVNPLGMVNYYDMLLQNSFGNFRDLLSAFPLTRAWGSI